MTDKFCKDCLSFKDTKPLPTCGSSKLKDLVKGGDKRTCLVERLDGIGYCGSYATNFKPK